MCPSYSKSVVPLYVVGPSTNWWNAARVESRVTCLKSPEMAINASISAALL